MASKTQPAAEPKVLTIKEIDEILNSGDFLRFKGARESQAFEAKPFRPYDITTVYGAAELAKEIAGMANKEPGYIICGLTTEKTETVFHDVVNGLALGAEDDFYTFDELNSKMRAAIHPAVNFTCKWYKSASDPKIGVGAIFIGEQDDSKRDFMTTITEMTGVSGRYFGIAHRTDDKTTWKERSEIYKLTKRYPSDWQKGFESLSEQIQEIREIVETALTKRPETKDPVGLLKKRLEEVKDEFK